MGDGEPRSAEGAAATDIVLGVLRMNGLMVAAGDRLAAPSRLTAARWQVLGAIALARRPMTVPRIARRMGLSRQSVQVSVNRLVDDGLIEAEENDDHQRSPLFRLTKLGTASYAEVDRRQVRWINELAAGLPLVELAATTRVLTELADRLATTARAMNERE